MEDERVEEGVLFRERALLLVCVCVCVCVVTKRLHDRYILA